jgi:hypothetical protein
VSVVEKPGAGEVDDATGAREPVDRLAMEPLRIGSSLSKACISPLRKGRRPV